MKPPKKQPPPTIRGFAGRMLFAAALWAVTVAACLLTPSPETGDSSGITMAFPASLGERLSEPAEPSEAELRLLPEDTEFAKAVYYPNEGDDPWDAAYCSIIRTGVDRRSIHRPEICMKGQGWTINRNEVVTIPLEGGKEFQVTDLALSRNEETEDGEIVSLGAHYVYWFVGKDRTTPSNTDRLLLTVRDNLLRNVNHRWAYASVMAYSTGSVDPAQGRSDEDTAKFIYTIIRDLYPHLHPSL